MTRAAQKNEEIDYAGEFLRDELRRKLAEVKPAIHDPPDCSAFVTNADGITTLVDLELAEYYVDNPAGDAGGSTAKRVTSCWDKVRANLSPQLEKLKLPVDVAVRFKEPVSLKNGQVSTFADELIRFAREFCTNKHLERTTHEAFPPEYTLLNEHVERIALTYLEGTVVICWHCSNITAAHIGVRRSHLADLVRRKSVKNFAWTPGAEKWFLVYASGGAVTSGGGWPPPDESIWDDTELVAACLSSVFDRIYFWERVRRWHNRLK
jgi:hypothetical protein